MTATPTPPPPRVQETARCAKCNGSGFVTWLERYGIDEWWTTNDCPDCSGTGCIRAAASADSRKEGEDG